MAFEMYHTLNFHQVSLYKISILSLVVLNCSLIVLKNQKLNLLKKRFGGQTERHVSCHIHMFIFQKQLIFLRKV